MRVLVMVRDAVPGSRVPFADGAGPDLRNYRVDFSKLAGTLMAGAPARLCYRPRSQPDDLVVAQWPTR